jgi:hypothetical protein
MKASDKYTLLFFLFSWGLGEDQSEECYCHMYRGTPDDNDGF